MFTEFFGQWLRNRSVNENKLFFRNAQWLLGRNAADSADLNLARVTVDDHLELGILPRYEGVIDALSPNKALVNKEYVLGILSGLRDPKDAVRVATVGNIDLASMPAAIDGVTLNAGDRILVKNQTLAAQNGIYVFVAAAAAATRAADADSDAEVTNGMSTLVTAGLVNVRRLFVLVTADPIVLGTTALSFVRAPNPADSILEQFEILSLDLTDLDTNGYKDLSVLAIGSSVKVTPVGGPLQKQGVDFTLSEVGGVTRITFGLSSTAGSLGEKLKEIFTVYGAVELNVYYERLVD